MPHSPGGHRDEYRGGLLQDAGGAHPRVRLVTVADMVAGHGIDAPPLKHLMNETYLKAQKALLIFGGQA